MDIFDTKWIEEFEKEDSLYKDFYKEQIQNIRLIMVYVDTNNSISFVRRSSISLEEGILKKQNLIALLKEYMYYNKKKYRPISLLKYNIDIGPDEVNSYLKTPTDYDFLSVEKKIDDINSLYIIFHESWNSFHNRTKKIYIKKKLKKGRRQTKRT